MEKRPLEEKSLQLERLVFFSDAVVAIAITLLALDIRIERTESGHLRFADIWNQWRTLTAFLLSFFNIANFWKTNHMFFVYIKKIDERLLWICTLWLLFIVLLPFSTSLVSNYFFDAPAICVYSSNVLLIAFFQNWIWDYASDRNLVDREKLHAPLDSRIRLFCNLDMLNGLVGVGISFISPVVAFVLLFTKIPTIVIAGIWVRHKYNIRRKGKRDPV
ncbi:MAG: DUF1211 domain-containing protein [Williamsia sp.]|nr:DUF1211 domain-containing protein [Williamsia sp.]